jgi:Colicin V production protein
MRSTEGWSSRKVQAAKTGSKPRSSRLSLDEPHADEELEPPSWLGWAYLGVIGGSGLLVVLAWMQGDTVAAIAAAILGAGTAQGLWRGAARIVGFLAATLLAMVLAPRVGPFIEGPVASLAGTGGLANRLLATVVAGIVIIALGSVIVGLFARRLMTGRANWRAWDRAAGGGLGAVEGLLLVMLLLWGIKAIEPIARVRAGASVDQEARVIDQGTHAAPTTTIRERHLVADRVLRWADAVDGSALGGVARRTNPIADSELMKIIDDFAVISRSPEARAWLFESPVMKKIEALPSIQHAIEVARNDPQLSGLYDASGISREALWTALNSAVLLRLLDETALVDELKPMKRELVESLKQARGTVR